MENIEQLSELLSHYGGQNALVLDDGHHDHLGIIARRFERVQLASSAAPGSGSSRLPESYSNVTQSVLQSGALPFSDHAFDAVFLFHALAGRTAWQALLKDSLRLLCQRGHLVILEYNTVVLTEQQAILLELNKLMHDRDASLYGEAATWTSSDELRRELRMLDLHHLRYVDFPPEDGRSDSVSRYNLKRDSLDRIKMDLLPSLSKLGARRDEFEKRLIELKRRIEISGVAPLGMVFVSGIKKTVYATTEIPLFASEALPLPLIKAQIEMPDVTVINREETPAADILDAEHLSTAELLSLAMTDGESRSRLEKLAKKILKEYGSRAVAEERNPQMLVDLLGISTSRATQIVAIFELGRRFFSSDEEAPVLRDPEDIFHYVADMGKLKREQFRGLYLNTRQRLVADEVISIGTLTTAILHAREVFRPALTHRAVSLILVHNHPSGDVDPSSEDITITRQLFQAGQILGIELLDHVIIGGDNWFSMKSADLF
jgi:DNA repair protein RadC